jgi:hypothetical protein
LPESLKGTFDVVGTKNPEIGMIRMAPGYHAWARVRNTRRDGTTYERTVYFYNMFWSKNRPREDGGQGGGYRQGGSRSGYYRSGGNGDGY